MRNIKEPNLLIETLPYLIVFLTLITAIAAS